MEAVKEGPKGPLGPGKMVALVAGLSVGAAAVGYIVYRTVSNGNPPLANMEESRMSVPLEVYRNISRHQASFLDLVNKQSGAQVRVVSETGEQSSVCFLLQGSSEQVLQATCVLENLAMDCEPIADVMEVPHTAFGRIIGRGGESLKLITRTTGARVNCPKEERGRGLEEKGKVSITGTRREVRQAKEMILGKVEEDQAVRKRIAQSSALRQKRRPQDPEVTEARPSPESTNEAPRSLRAEEEVLFRANGTTGETERAEETAQGPPAAKAETREEEEEEEEDVISYDSLSEVSKFEIPSPDLSFQPDEHLEVYISASENPHHFWIQILGVRSLQLDKLIREMSRFYSSGTPSEQRVETIVVGDIVAAPYRDYGTWNRARVLGVLGSGLVDLYYVDFGDNGELPRDSLRSMRSDFLSLPFQAIECSLAGVSPAGEVWSEAAMDDFDRLTYCAEWRPLLAKLCSYSHSEVSSWPSVQLYDNSEGKAVDLGEELVRLGHAVCCQDTGNGRDDPGSLQRMLDDVTGATSELSLSCISLSGNPLESGEWETEQVTTPFSSRRSPGSREFQRADVEQSLSPRLGLVFDHSTPAQPLALASRTLESSGPIPDPLDSDQQASDRPRDALNRTPGLDGAPVRPLHLTYTLPLSTLFSASTSTSTSSSSAGAATSAMASLALSDNVFLAGTGYDGDAESDVTGSSETWGNSSSHFSSETGESLREESSSGEVISISSDGVISIGSSTASSSASQERRHLGDDGEDGQGGGELSSGDLHAFVVGCEDSSCSCTSSGSDVVYMGSEEPVEEQSCTCSQENGCGHICEDAMVKSRIKVPEREVGEDEGEPKVDAQGSEAGVGGSTGGLPGNNLGQDETEDDGSRGPSGGKEVASISGSVDDVIEDEML